MKLQKKPPEAIFLATLFDNYRHPGHKTIYLKIFTLLDMKVVGKSEKPFPLTDVFLLKVVMFVWGISKKASYEFLGHPFMRSNVEPEELCIRLTY